MTEWEVRTADNLAVRVLAENELEALETAGPMLPENAEGIVVTALEAGPVGSDGEDPEAGALDDPEDR